MPPHPPGINCVSTTPDGKKIVISKTPSSSQQPSSTTDNSSSRIGKGSPNGVMDPLLEDTQMQKEEFNDSFYVTSFFLHEKSSVFDPNKKYAGLVFYGATPNEDYATLLSPSLQSSSSSSSTSVTPSIKMDYGKPAAAPDDGEHPTTVDFPTTGPPSLQDPYTNQSCWPEHSFTARMWNGEKNDYDFTTICPGTVFIFDSQKLPSAYQLAMQNAETGGRVHGALFYQLTTSTFNYELKSNYDVILLEGFSYQDGEAKFNSRFFNKKSSEYHNSDITMCDKMSSIVLEVIERWKTWSGLPEECPQVSIDSETYAQSIRVVDDVAQALIMDA